MPWLLHQLFLHCRSIELETRVNFMGSSNPGVARFNEKFGTSNKTYFEV
jgi:hypothetical protein